MSKLFNLVIGLFAIALFSCSEEYTPKPKAYPRIDLPSQEYTTYTSDCPFTFDYHIKAKITRASKDEPCWLNVDYPQFHCRIHLSYRRIENNLPQMLEDSRTLVYKHTIKANAINQRDIIREEDKVYSKIYEINGDAASSVQFISTDSTKHFLRGSLYFSAASNSDSLGPAINYIREDVEHLVNSILWK